MPAETDPTMTVVVVSTFDDVPLARATVRTVLAQGQARCLVIDLDRRYRPCGEEEVVSFLSAASHLGLDREAGVACMTLGPAELASYAGVVGASYAESMGSDGVVVLGAGVLLLGDLGEVLPESGVVVVPATDTTGVARRAAVAPVRMGREWDTGLLTVEGPGAGDLYSRALYALRGDGLSEQLRELAADWRVAGDALEAFAGAADATVSASLLITPWRAVGETTLDPQERLCVDGAPVPAVDLTALDANRPWTLVADAPVSPCVLLSDHPALAEVVGVEAKARRRDAPDGPGSPDLAIRPARLRMDSVLRSEARRVDRARGTLPDVLGSDGDDDLGAWAVQLVPEGDPHPVARYLAAVRMARPDLQRDYRQVPGRDSEGLARWALEKGVKNHRFEGDWLARAGEDTLAAQSEVGEADAAVHPLLDGVNLVGYLAGEMGLGESARLVDSALRAIGIPTSTYDVSGDLESRRGAGYRLTKPQLHATSVICMNAAETAAAAPRMKRFIRRTRVIGMWYWELEDFPAAHRSAFKYVDEVWAATDFIREAIARDAPPEIEVRTVTPPLPQAGSDAGVVPERFGIPSDRPWFLFVFDFFSMADRKNPLGLVEAFTRAFGDRPMAERPVLVIKTINADRHPGDAERLRLLIAGRSDVLFVDAYLDHDERHVLVSHCTAFVSLHKAEGLGLTVAEAMSWGRPVITTAYGGVMQFCTEQNSFLVDWHRGFVERAVGPYAEGLPWAEPDLDQAAQLMRAVIDDPGRAAAVGEQAARDIRELHNAEVAGARMREVLAEGDVRWRAEKDAARADRQRARRERRVTEAKSSEKPPADVSTSDRTLSDRARRLARAGKAKVVGRVESAKPRRLGD